LIREGWPATSGRPPLSSAARPSGKGHLSMRSACFLHACEALPALALGKLLLRVEPAWQQPSFATHPPTLAPHQPSPRRLCLPLWFVLCCSWVIDNLYAPPSDGAAAVVHAATVPWGRERQAAAAINRRWAGGASGSGSQRQGAAARALPDLRVSAATAQFILCTATAWQLHLHSCACIVMLGLPPDTVPRPRSCQPLRCNPSCCLPCLPAVLCPRPVCLPPGDQLSGHAPAGAGRPTVGRPVGGGHRRSQPAGLAPAQPER
jgi:hypothetical protein